MYTPPRGVHTPICPHTPLCICMFSEASTCCGGVVKGPLHVGHLPLYGGASPYDYTSHSFIGFPVHQYVLGYMHVIWGIFPLCWQFEGVPHLLGVLGASAHGVFICLFLYILVVHYVSCLSYGYDYYSSQLWWCFLGCDLFHQ